MAKQRMVKTVPAALARTNKPVHIVGDGLQNVIAGLGTARDKRTGNTYSMPQILTRQDLENMYRVWLPRKIVNLPAEDMTREWVDYMFDDATDEDAAEASQKTIDLWETKFGIRQKVTDAIRWGRLYGGALLIIGTNDTSDLSKPLDVSRLGKDCLRYVHVVDRWRVSPSGSMCTDLGSPNFGFPDSYVVAESSVIIHHSRVLRFGGAKVPYFVWVQNAWWDDPILTSILDAVRDMDATSAGIATMVFEANIDVIKSGMVSELLATKGGDAKIIDRFQLSQMMKSYNRTLILDAEEEYEKKGNTFANLDKILERFMVNVAGAADIPVTRLFGQSASGLSATGDNDTQNYYDMIAAKQEADLRPALNALFEIACRHCFGSVPEDFRFDFRPLWQMSDKDKADIEFSNAQRDKIYLEAGVITEGRIAAELKDNGTYTTLTSEDVDLAEDLATKTSEHDDVMNEAARTTAEANAEAAKNPPADTPAPGAE